MTTGGAGRFVPSCHKVTTFEISLFLGRDQPQGPALVAVRGQALGADGVACMLGIFAPANESE